MQLNLVNKVTICTVELCFKVMTHSSIVADVHEAQHTKKKKIGKTSPYTPNFLPTSLQRCKTPFSNTLNESLYTV